MDDVISLAQYEDVHTFGINSMKEVEELNKALEAGYQNPPESGGSALRVESLESSLKVLTHQAKHCAFWQKVPKLPAYSTVEEFNQLVSVGSEGGAFLPEGILPETGDSSYSRQVELVKFLGTTRSVTHPMTLVRSSIGDVVAQENTNGILWILKNLEWAMFNGDADMCFGGVGAGAAHREWVEFNGLEKQIDSGNMIDLKGSALSEGTFSDAAQMIASNYGVPTDAFLSFSAHEDLCKIVFPNERAILPTPANGYSIGANVTDVNTPFGKITLNPDVFLNSGKTAPGVATCDKAPQLPQGVALAVVPMAGDDGVWASHGGAGTYSYAVSAMNRYGESAAVNIDADLTVVAGDVGKHADIEITNAAALTTPPEYFNIYKTAVNGSVKYLVGRIAAESQAAGGVTTFHDTGLWMAATSKAFIGELTPQVVAAKQLAPLMKMDLATVAPSIRWMILCYLTFILYAPKKWVKIINIGRA
jgi:hypothetical protein